MGGREVLAMNRRIDAILKAQAAGQLQPHHRLEPDQHRILAHLAVGDQRIAVFTIGLGEQAMGFGGLPESDVTQGRQPILNILNVFKHHTSLMLPEIDLYMQVSGGRP